MDIMTNAQGGPLNQRIQKAVQDKRLCQAFEVFLCRLVYKQQPHNQTRGVCVVLSIAKSCLDL